MTKRIAVLFPGIGYSFDRPLLHFAMEQAKQYNYEIYKAAYTGFPEKIRGNQERLQESIQIARKQTKEILKDIDWSSYDSVIFISKSIGTIVAAEYADTYDIPARQIFFTPFPETFSFPIKGEACGFHAAEDPWMDHETLMNAAEKAGVPLKVYPEGNHSLETGDVLQDIKILDDVFHTTKKIFELNK